MIFLFGRRAKNTQAFTDAALKARKGEK